MWKLLKFCGRLIKAVFWLVLMLFIGGLVLLYCAERGLPDALVQKIAERLSSYANFEGATSDPAYASFVFRIDKITYSMRRGLTIHKIKAFPMRVTEGAFISADEVTADFSLFSFAPLRDRLKTVTLKGFDFPADHFCFLFPLFKFFPQPESGSFRFFPLNGQFLQTRLQLGFFG